MWALLLRESTEMERETNSAETKVKMLLKEAQQMNKKQREMQWRQER